MKNTSAGNLVRKNADDVRRAASLQPLRRSARRTADTSDIPEVQFTASGESHRIRKRSVTLRLDEDVVDFFRSQGTGYQTRINRALRAAIHPAENLRDQLKKTACLLEQLAERVK